MAKAKSKKITIEDALVPVDEQPYEVPENWCWTTLDQVCFFENGYAFKSDKFSDNGIPVIRISNIFDNEVSIEGCVYTTEENIDDRFIIKNGDLLIAMSGATTGKNGVFLSYQKAYLNQRVGNIKVINHNVLLEGFRNYYIASKQEEILRNAYGGAQPNIGSAKIGKMLFPLPPLPEQQRIVEQIESLFSKLDEAKEKIQTVIDTAEERRESILYKAFRGELTNKWREENNKNIDNWESAKVKDICLDVKVGIVIKPTQYYTDSENGTPAFRSANVRETYIEDNDWVYLTEQGVKDNKRSEVHSGDVLIVRSGNPGTACVVTDQYDGYNAIDIIIAVPNKKKILPDFLCYYTNSPECKGLVKENKRGMALQHFNVGSYSKLPIMVPSLEEQAEIVLILKEVLQKDDNAMDTAEQLLKQIELMKKSILAKAFRGELGTNDPSEESSIELLKQIIAKGGIGV